MAAAIATMEVVIYEDLPEQSRIKGDYFLTKLKGLQAKYPKLIKEARGLGLMIGIEFLENSYGWDFSKGVFKKGVIVSGTLNNSRVIRIEPPLTIKYEQIDYCVKVMDESLSVQYKSLFGESGNKLSRL